MLKKMKTWHWIALAVVVYFLFFHETEVSYTQEDANGGELNPSAAGRYSGVSNFNTGKKDCPPKMCKSVRRRGILGIGRRVGKDWCHKSGDKCMCLDRTC